MRRLWWRFRNATPDQQEQALLFAGAAAALLVMLMFGGCAPALYRDPGPLAVDAGDASALLVGCGEEQARGSLYCRFPAGWRPTGAVYVMVPPTDCGAASCATVTVMSPDASVALDMPVPRGQAAVALPWSSLVGAAPLAANQRGFWPVVLRWSWRDPDSGVVMQAAAEGEIRLRVYKGSYTPLAFDPAAQTWTWTVGGKTYGATDAGRTAVKP